MGSSFVFFLLFLLNYYIGLQSLCSSQEHEIDQLYSINDDLKARILDLASKNQEICKEKYDLQTKFDETQTKLNEKTEEIESEKAKYDAQIDKFDLTEKSLIAKVTGLSSKTSRFIILLKFFFFNFRSNCYWPKKTFNQSNSTD